MGAIFPPVNEIFKSYPPQVFLLLFKKTMNVSSNFILFWTGLFLGSEGLLLACFQG